MPQVRFGAGRAEVLYLCHEREDRYLHPQLVRPIGWGLKALIGGRLLL